MMLHTIMGQILTSFRLGSGPPTVPPLAAPLFVLFAMWSIVIGRHR